MHVHGERTESQALETSVSEEDARAELARVLDDPEFHSTERNKKFLRFVAEEFFQGRSEAVKAYSVAVDVFGRPPTFDPAIDPIVRIEATRLRASLNRYYERHGRCGGVYIDLPKGRYVPVFGKYGASGRDGPTPASEAGKHTEEATSPQLQENIRKLPRKTWVVLSFAGLGAIVLGAMAVHDLAEGAGGQVVSDKPRVVLETRLAGEGVDAEATQFQELLLGALAKFQTLKVAAGSQATASRTGLVDNLLSTAGTSRTEQSSYRLGVSYDGRIARWQVANTKTGEILVSGEERPTSDGGSAGGAEERLVDQVATRLAGVRGVINGLETAREMTSPTLGNGCLLRSYLALGSPDSEALDSARGCLETTLTLLKGDADVHATLARVLLETDPVDAPTGQSERALLLADKAASLAPYSDRAAEAQMLALQRLGRTRAAIAAGRRGMSLNPDNAGLAARLSESLLVAGEWQHAVVLAARSERIGTGLYPEAELTLAFEDYRLGRFEQAAERLREMGGAPRLGASILLAATLGQLGRTEDMPTVQTLRDQYPGTLRTAMTARHFGAELIGLIEAGLAKADIPLD